MRLTGTFLDEISFDIPHHNWGVEEWEADRIGAGCPPIKTKDGWLLIYHGVSGADQYYRVGMVLLDLENLSYEPKSSKDFPNPTTPYLRGSIDPLRLRRGR